MTATNDEREKLVLELKAVAAKGAEAGSYVSEVKAEVNRLMDSFGGAGIDVVAEEGRKHGKTRAKKEVAEMRKVMMEMRDSTSVVRKHSQNVRPKIEGSEGSDDL